MASQQWYTPEIPGGPIGAPQSPVPAAAYELRPLTLSEILDRTFSVYRSRFWLFAGIGAFAAALQTAMSALQLIPLHMGKMGPRAAPIGSAAMAGLMGGFFIGIAVFAILYMLAFAITQAATVFAVSEVYLGKQITVAESFSATWRKWYRQVGVAIWQSWSFAWLPIVLILPGAILLGIGSTGLKVVGGGLLFLGILGGVPAGIILALRNALGVQATVIEQLTVRASMRRSKFLTDGAKGRIFVMGLVAGALNYVAGMLQMPLMMFVTFTLAKGGHAVGSEIAMLLVSFVAHAAVSPVMMIGVSLIYFDQRVRKEALDLVMLMSEASPTGFSNVQLAPTDQQFPPATASEANAISPVVPNPDEPAFTDGHRDGDDVPSA